LSETPTHEEVQAATRKIMFPLLDALEIWQETMPESPKLNIVITTKNANNFEVIMRKLP
jgi:hypothetical protein